MLKEYKVAVVGATGVVGHEILEILAERNFPISELVPLASERSAGSTIEFKGEDIKVQLLTENSFDNIDLALFSAGGSVSAKFAPIAASKGVTVVDNTSHFRMDPKVPLVVPEVNPKDLKKHNGIIANPNCSTAQMVLPLKVIKDMCGIKRIVVSTYQSVSGAGKEAMDELMNQSTQLLNGKKIEPKKFPKQIAFNVLPHIDIFLDSGYTKEEMKMVEETKKILGDDKIKVTATTVRVPVFISHSESVNVETIKPFDLEEIKKAFAEFPGIKVMDDPKNLVYPTPIDSAGQDATLVGRIRRDISCENGIEMFVVADNLRKGAALNAVQIAERLVLDGLL